MVNKIDKEEFKFINLDFIQRTNLRLAPASLDSDGTDSLQHLQNIIDSDKPMIKTICLEHAAVKEKYRNATNVAVNNSRILEFHFIWGRMMLELYYFYHDSREDALKIVDKMLFYEGVSLIKEAVRAGIKLIDEYFEAEWKENIQDTSPEKKIKLPKTIIEKALDETVKMFTEDEEPAPQQPSLTKNPDILQLMQDIDSGKISLQNVDWEFQLKYLLLLCRLMPKKYPDVLLVWSILGQVEDPTTKMDIIGKLQSVAPVCFNDPFYEYDFINDCDCIYQVCLKAREYNLRNDIGRRHYWKDDRKDLNDLAHIFSDVMVDPQWMVGMIEEMKRSENDNRKHPMLEIVLRANRNIGRLSVDNIVDFAKRLYIAEGFRQMILSGQEDYRDIPTLEKFSWRLRNACFDIYINIRKEKIRDLLNQDNTRVDEADDMEAMQYMYKQESDVVEREKGLEAFQGSPAYNAMWYPGKKIVEDMITVFMKYLEKKINEIKKAEIAKQNVAPIYADHVSIADNHGTIQSIENSNVTINK